MGIVVEAEHVQLETRVAVKFLHPHLVTNEHAVKRIVREARAAALVHGTNVVRVLDVDTTDEAQPYIVMEFLEGNDLHDEIERRGALPVAEAVGYILHACFALAEIHANGMVHRDLKPANIFLARGFGGTTAKVLDFGVAKMIGGASLTAGRTPVGSPHYMSPEQMHADPHLDARADIWAVGATLYETLTGQRAFDGESLGTVVAAVLSHHPIPIAALAPHVPPDLANIVETCLTKAPSSRFQTVIELAAALEPFAASALNQEETETTSLMSVNGPQEPLTGFIPDSQKTAVADFEVTTLSGEEAPDQRRPSRSKVRRYTLLTSACSAAAALGVWLAVQSLDGQRESGSSGPIRQATFDRPPAPSPHEPVPAPVVDTPSPSLKPAVAEATPPPPSFVVAEERASLVTTDPPPPEDTPRVPSAKRIPRSNSPHTPRGLSSPHPPRPATEATPREDRPPTPPPPSSERPQTKPTVLELLDGRH